MERTFLVWNIENWITVLLMAALGYLLLSLLSQIVRQWFGSANDNQTVQLDIAA